MEKYLIKISKTDWDFYTSPDYFSIRNSDSYPRGTFKASFTYILDEKLKNLGIICGVKCKFNWFNKFKSNWYGVYKCIHHDCPVVFQATIDSVDTIDQIRIEIKQLGEPNHTKKIPIRRQIKGSERENIGNQVCSIGVANVLYKNIMFNKQKKSLNENLSELKIENAKLLSSIKFGILHKHRLSSDHFADCQAAKRLFDYFTSSKPLVGFLQSIQHDPYGIVLLSYIQIEIWKIVQQLNPVWFFDASGEIHRKIPSQPYPLFYSMVFHDPFTKKILPVAEFVTVVHTTESIAEKVHSICNMIESQSAQIAPISVTDNSWAMTGAILKAINGHSASTYINLCFDILVTFSQDSRVNQLRDLIKTRTILCSTHYLKNFIKEIKKKTRCVKTRKLIIFCFSLLQDCSSIDQFDKYLAEIYLIFNSKKKTNSVDLAKKTLRDEIANRSLSKISVSRLLSDKQTFVDEKRKESLIVYSNPSLNNEIKKNSPFVKYYENLLSKWSEKKEDSDSCEENRFFAPQAFSAIINRLYLMPLWSSVMIGDWLKTNEIKLFRHRLTNNPVENRFKQIKYHLLHGMTKVSCSELLTATYRQIEALYEQFYRGKDASFIKAQAVEQNKEKNKKKNKKGKKKKAHEEEGWNKKNKRNEKKMRRKKGFYTSEWLNFADINPNDEIENELETADFKQVFDEQSWEEDFEIDNESSSSSDLEDMN